MNNLLCREEREKCSYDAGRKEWLGGRHVESNVQRRAKNDMKVGGWNSQDLCIRSAEAVAHTGKRYQRDCGCSI